MIQLHPDYLMFQLPDGNAVPCSVETVTVELIGDAADYLDPEVIKNAAAAVLHYFQDELHRQCVSVGEFSNALEQVLRGFGFQVVTAASQGQEQAAEMEESAPEAALDEMAEEAGKGGELLFFPRLREELHRQLEHEPRRVCFSGLKPCVKQLLGMRRWSPRCQGMSDRIVNYLRDCLQHESQQEPCAVVIK